MKHIKQYYASKKHLCIIQLTSIQLCLTSVATAIAADFAILPNKIAKIMGKFENVDKAKSRGVFCQH
jgi:hypothetical protein